MQRQWDVSRTRIVNVLDANDKALFSSNQPITLELVNAKLNLLFDILTDTDNFDTESTAAEKGIQSQVNNDNSVDTKIDLLGQAIVDLQLK